MTIEEIHIERAGPADLPEILALLSASSLPPDGVAEHIADFLVGRDLEGRLVGCAAIEQYGETGLLRSVAVVSELQRSGLGSLLVGKALIQAPSRGIKEVVLLTATARDFFARRFGFTETTRAPFDQKLASSAEWGLPHCSSAVVMSLRLVPEATA